MPGAGVGGYLGSREIVCVGGISQNSFGSVLPGQYGRKTDTKLEYAHYLRDFKEFRTWQAPLATHCRHGLLLLYHRGEL